MKMKRWQFWQEVKNKQKLGQRLGQAVFNTLADIDQDKIDFLVDEWGDPFYDDCNIKNIIEHWGFED
jgi:hypothetical protein